MAGVNGAGGSSYIDSVVMRERDNTAWGSAVSSWALTGRQYLLQNWRADVVLAIDSGGSITDRIRYSAYGEPQRYSLCDLVGGGASGTAPDTLIDGNDYTAFNNAFGASDALADVNGDGVVDSSDYTLFINNYSAGGDGPLGTGVLSTDLDAGFRRGYAGYEFDPVLGGSVASVYHVRNRVYDAESGRWNRRNPLGYVDGMGLYEYCRDRPVDGRDAVGMKTKLISGAADPGDWPGPEFERKPLPDPPPRGIEIRCMPIVGGVAEHCYVVFPDRTACRGGPDGSSPLSSSSGQEPDSNPCPPGAPSGPGGSLKTKCGTYDRSFTDHPSYPGNTRPSYPLLYVPDPGGSIAACMQRRIEYYNCRHAYDPLRSNSNATIGSALRCCAPGFGDASLPTRTLFNIPGWSTSLGCAQIVSY